MVALHNHAQECCPLGGLELTILVVQAQARVLKMLQELSDMTAALFS